MEKRGQITIFIILGVVLLIIAGVVIYFTAIKEKGTTSTGAETGTRTAYTPNPISQYVESCIEDIGTEALERLGTGGGYINASKFGYYANEIDPTSGNSLMFAPGTEHLIPYWFYLSSGNRCTGNCEIKASIPLINRDEDPKSSMESQIDTYINDNLKRCLHSFSDFDDYTVTEKGKIETTTEIINGKALFSVKYPIEAREKATNTVTRMEDFNAEVETSLTGIYALAYNITRIEADTHFLESHLKNLIAAFSGLDESKLPPTEDFDMSSTKKMWMKTKVKQDLQMVLMSYVPALQMQGTANFNTPFFGNNYIKQAMYSNMIIMNNITYPYEVKFKYLDWWPIYFDIDSNGEIITAEAGSSKLLSSIFNLNRYSFGYDVSYPVLVEIYDPNAFQGKGYRFYFALEANLRQNEPLSSDYFRLYALGSGDTSQLCDENQRNSGTILVETKDAVTGKLLEGVNIKYTCASETCAIGDTKNDTNTSSMYRGRSVLKTQFPICYGGIISAQKEGYQGVAQLLHTSLEKSESITLELQPYRNFNVKIMKKGIKKTGSDWNFDSSTVKALETDELAIVSLENIRDVGKEEFQLQFAKIEGNAAQPNATIQLVPGKYKVDLQVMKFFGQGWTLPYLLIPEDEICVDTTPLNPFDDDDCTTVAPIYFNDSFPLGKLLLDNSTGGYFEITAQDIEGKSEIVLYAVTLDLPDVPEAQRKHKDLEQLSKLDAVAKANRAAVKPVFK